MQWEHYELDLLAEKEKEVFTKRAQRQEEIFVTHCTQYVFLGLSCLGIKMGGGNYLNQASKLITGICANI